MHATKKDVEAAITMMLSSVTIILLAIGIMGAIEFFKLDEVARKSQVEISMLKSLEAQTLAIHKETKGEIKYNFERASDQSVRLAQTMDQFIEVLSTLRR